MPNSYHCWSTDTVGEELCSLQHLATYLHQRSEAVPCVFTQSTGESSELFLLPVCSLCAMSAGDRWPGWQLSQKPWGLLCSSSSGLINSLCMSSWKLNCSVLPEIQYSAETFSVSFCWQTECTFAGKYVCCSSREGADHAALVKSLWEDFSAYSSPLVTRTSLTALPCQTISAFVSCHGSCSKSKTISLLLPCSKSEIIPLPSPLPFEEGCSLRLV